MVRGECFRIRAPRRARGSEQSGVRYAVVVQSDLVAAGATVLVLPTSRSAMEAPFRPEIAIAGSRTRVLADKARSSSVERLGESVGRLSAAELLEVDEALRIVFGLR